MSLSRILFALVFVTAWGAVLLAVMPIKLMIEQWGAPAGVAISAPSGTLWNGQAEFEFKAGKSPVMAVVHWSWCPSWGRGLLSACFEIENEALSGHGFLYGTFFGDKVGVENARMQVQFGKYADRFLPLPVKVVGSGNINIDKVLLDWRARLPEELNASGRLTRMKAGETELGDYLWRLSTNAADRSIEARASGGADAFQIKAQARLSPSDRSYQYEAELSSVNQAIQGIVSPFAKKKSEGVYTTAGEGVLEPF